MSGGAFGKEFYLWNRNMVESIERNILHMLDSNGVNVEGEYGAHLVNLLRDNKLKLMVTHNGVYPIELYEYKLLDKNDELLSQFNLEVDREKMIFKIVKIKDSGGNDMNTKKLSAGDRVRVVRNIAGEKNNDMKKYDRFIGKEGTVIGIISNNADFDSVRLQMFGENNTYWYTNEVELIVEKSVADQIARHIGVESKKNEKKKLYLAGGIMSRGEFLAREFEYNELLKTGVDLDIYSPVKNKSINDKQHQTVESNNTLSTRIVRADMDRLLESDIVVAEYQNFTLGTISEIAILYMMKQAKQMMDDIFERCVSDEDIVCEMAKLRNKFDKDVRIHSSDIRNTNLPEMGYKRSHSYNQFCLGLIEDVTNDKSIQDFEVILEELKSDYK